MSPDKEKQLGTHAMTEASETLIAPIDEILAEDVRGMSERMTAFQELALHADRIVIALTCCDSREVFPTELTDGVLYLTLPTIGGGAPSERTLNDYLGEVVSWGVDLKKVFFMVTQHGDGEELHQLDSDIDETERHAACDHITCGLRAVFQGHADVLTTLHQLLNENEALSMGTISPDEMNLDELFEAHPEISTLVSELHTETHIPKRLILRAAAHNGSSHLVENAQEVQRIVQQHLQTLEKIFSDLNTSATLAYYDHNAKMVKTLSDAGVLQRELKATPRDNDFQDPRVCVISVGERVAAIPPELLLPHIALTPDNEFTTTATRKTKEAILSAFAEAWYAVAHAGKVTGSDGNNFKSLERVVVICQDAEATRMVTEILSSDPEFATEFQSWFEKMGPVSVITLSDTGDTNHETVTVG